MISPVHQNTCKVRAKHVFCTCKNPYPYKGRGFPYKGRGFPYKNPYKIRIFPDLGIYHFLIIFHGFVHKKHEKNIEFGENPSKSMGMCFFPLVSDYPAKSRPKIVAQPGNSLQKAGV